MEKSQIRAIFLYEYKLGTKATETARKMNEAFGHGTVSARMVQRWNERFRQGDETLDCHDGRGRTSDINNDQLKKIIEADPSKSTREVAEEMNVDHTTVLRHLNQIGKVKKMDKWVPHLLSEKQKIRRFEVASSLLLRNNNDPFLHRIVTCDEKWILLDNRRRSAQWLDHDEAPKHFPKPNLHQTKVMVTVWWSMTGLIHHNFLNPGETITAERYCQHIQEMNEKLKLSCPALINRKGPIILQDNARPHVAQTTLQKFHELGYEILPHPPYSPDLSPTDFHFFKHLDNFLLNRCFKNRGDAETAFDEFVVSRSKDFYSIGINKLVNRWQKCIASNGFYFD